MAKDYRKYNHEDNFLFNVENNNIYNNINLYPSGRTGYEQYYTDIEGFWRLLYNPESTLKIKNIKKEDITDNIEKLYIKYPYKKVTENDLINVDLNDLYVIYNG
jgi:hypothetical protein